MKPKNLKKKIRQLEKRLREGPKKLAKLKRKLQAAESQKTSKGSSEETWRQCQSSSQGGRREKPKRPHESEEKT